MQTILKSEQIARIFSLYLNQQVLMWKDDLNPKEPFLLAEVGIRTCKGYYNETNDYIDSNINYDVDRFVLKLKSLSSLEEEDARNIARIIFPYFFDFTSQCKKNSCIVTLKKGDLSKELIFLLKEDYESFSKKLKIDKINNILIYQYLISKGYAVPMFIEIYHPSNGLSAIELGIATND